MLFQHIMELLCENDNIFVTVKNFKNRPSVNIRRYYESEGYLQAGVPGVSFNQHEWRELRKRKLDLERMAAGSGQSDVWLSNYKLAYVEESEIFVCRPHKNQDASVTIPKRDVILLSPDMWMKLFSLGDWIEKEITQLCGQVDATLMHESSYRTFGERPLRCDSETHPHKRSNSGVENDAHFMHSAQATSRESRTRVSPFAEESQPSRLRNANKPALDISRKRVGDFELPPSRKHRSQF